MKKNPSKTMEKIREIMKKNPCKTRGGNPEKFGKNIIFFTIFKYLIFPANGLIFILARIFKVYI